MSYEEKGGPADIGEAEDNNSSKLNNTLKNVTTQEIIPILHNKTAKDVETRFEPVQGYPSFQQYTLLRKIVDLTASGVWVRFDDNVVSAWFGANWKKAVTAASEMSKQNGWAFRHDKNQGCCYFGRAYPRLD